MQGQPEAEFPKRMYTYNYRIFDRYDKPVVSLAILSDDQPNWHPKQFRYALWGSEVSLKFGTAKLLDYEAHWDELVDNPSPFAVVVMAHLKMLATRRDPEVRYDWKFTLFKMLYERGHSRRDILELWRFIDWLVFLPADLEKKLEVAMINFEKVKTMRYVTNIERRGRHEAIHEDILDVLAIRFGLVPEDVRIW